MTSILDTGFLPVLQMWSDSIPILKQLLDIINLNGLKPLKQRTAWKKQNFLLLRKGKTARTKLLKLSNT